MTQATALPRMLVNGRALDRPIDAENEDYANTGTASGIAANVAQAPQSHPPAAPLDVNIITKIIESIRHCVNWASIAWAGDTEAMVR